MKRLTLLAALFLAVLFALSRPSEAAEKFAFKLSFSSASVNGPVKKGTSYSMRCTVPVRYATGTGNGTVALVGVADGGPASFYVDSTSLPFFDFKTTSSDTYVAVIPDPAAAGYCEFFERVTN